MSITRRPEEAISRKQSQATRWLIGLSLSAIVGFGLVLMFLLTQATNNRESYEQHYAWLFVVNVSVAAVLLLVTFWIGLRLWQRLRQGKFGSRLLVKLAAVFAVAGFLPGVLIYGVSYQFVSRSIESWFDVRVEGALGAGLNLGRSTLEALSAELGRKARAAAEQLTDLTDAAAALPMERARNSVDVDTLMLWSESGRLVVSVGLASYQLTPEKPDAQYFRSARSQRVVTWIEGLDEGIQGRQNASKVKAMVLLSSRSFAVLGEPRYLLLVKALPTQLVTDAMAVTQANREYQERALARDGLKRMYIGTLTLSLFLAVFGGVLLAVILGNQIARPLLLLADGVRQVAAGDLSPKPVLRGKDELDGLTRAFADMTDQLADARHALDDSMSQVNAARANLQTILDNLTTGVIVLEADGQIVNSNPGATRILRLPMAALQGQYLSAVPGLKDFAEGVAQQFAAMLDAGSEHGIDYWQQSFVLGQSVQTQDDAAHSAITLVARGARLPGSQCLLVFDDISEIVSAQRAQAWGEVARRLAHEIKNPLTPIQLSAERLARKLDGKLEQSDQTVLDKSVRVIVDQVEAMKRLVNEFRDYARLPTADLKPLDLNALIVELVQLYASDSAVVPVTVELDAQCPPILGDAQQLRQVLHNLLQNAQDATLAQARSAADKIDCAPAAATALQPVVLRTQWRGTSKRVRMTVLDSGGGFGPDILKRAFEPYVTTKEKGTGLGLAVVKKIADEHAARIEIVNRVQDDEVLGAQVSLSFATEASTQ